MAEQTEDTTAAEQKDPIFLPLEGKLAFLKSKLGRDVTVSQLKDGSYLADYISYGAPALQLIGHTETEAIEKLYFYLAMKDRNPTPAAEK